MDDVEFLQTLHLPEALHRQFSSSERQVQILCPVAQSAAGFLSSIGADYRRSSAIWPQIVRDDDFGVTMQARSFSWEFQCCTLVARACNVPFKHLAFVIGGAPKVVTLGIDFHDDLVEVSSPSTGLQPVDPASPVLRDENRTAPVPPEPNRFIADFDATPVQQLLDIAERLGKPDIQHNRQADDFRAALKAFERAGFS